MEDYEKMAELLQEKDQFIHKLEQVFIRYFSINSLFSKEIR